MIDAVYAEAPNLRSKVEGMGIGAKLYVSSRPANARIPHLLFRSVDETVYRFAGATMGIAELHIWATEGVVRDIEDVVAYLDDHVAPDHRSAQAPHFRLQNKSRVSEPENIQHTVIIYRIDVGDKRKLLA